MPLGFQKSRTNRIFQDVVDQIEAAIIDGRLQPGELLPAEMKLKEMFHTSRGSIREALRVLEQKGLVAIKTGVTGGARVRPVDTRAMADGLRLLLRVGRVTPDQLTQTRVHLEGIAAAEAAARVRLRDLRELHRRMEDVRPASAPEFVAGGEFVERMLRVPLFLAEIAGNPVFAAVLETVHANLLECVDAAAWDRSEQREEDYRALQTLVSAVQEGNGEAARQLAGEFARRLDRCLKPDKGQPPGRE